eukprot:TRINITY_DN23639_c0_g1_i1.p1 TRINITY_DN23639_c0_g1~~TRINITY_DN23639_c0_g1_i1.p1  ORF type:complete len:561 (-),score=97.27 TRINITY_DN23639_c0_g1_i1:253-1872(-)
MAGRVLLRAASSTVLSSGCGSRRPPALLTLLSSRAAPPPGSVRRAAGISDVEGDAADGAQPGRKDVRTAADSQRASDLALSEETLSLAFDAPLLADSLALGVGSVPVGAGSMASSQRRRPVGKGDGDESLREGSVSQKPAGEELDPIEWMPSRDRKAIAAALQPPQALPPPPQSSGYGYLRHPLPRPLAPVQETVDPEDKAAIRAEFLAAFEEASRLLDAEAATSTSHTLSTVPERVANAAAFADARAEMRGRLLGTYESKGRDGALLVHHIEASEDGGFIARSRSESSAEASGAPVSVWQDKRGGIRWGSQGRVVLDEFAGTAHGLVWRHEDGRTWTWTRRKVNPDVDVAASGLGFYAVGATKSSTSSPRASLGVVSFEKVRPQDNGWLNGPERLQALVSLADKVIQAYEREVSALSADVLETVRNASSKGDVIGATAHLAAEHDALEAARNRDDPWGPSPQASAETARKVIERMNKLRPGERRAREDAVLILFSDAQMVEWSRLRRLLLSPSPQAGRGGFWRVLSSVRFPDAPMAPK